MKSKSKKIIVADLDFNEKIIMIVHYSTYRLNSTSIASPGLETPLGSYIVSKVDSSEKDSFSSLRKGNPLIREPFRISIDPLLDSTIKKSRNKN